MPGHVAEMRNSSNILSGKPHGRSEMGGMGPDRGIILKLTFRKVEQTN
jgi:hypothetical protein